MLNIFKKLWKNKIFIAFALMIILVFPTIIYKQSDKDTTIVVTSLGIDKEEDEYKITILAVVPKGSEDIGSNLEVFDSTGSSLPEALDKISFNLGKKIGLAHCDAIVLAEQLLEENITSILDFFIRTKNLSTNPNIVATPKSANELLKCVKSTSNMLELDFKSIITNQENKTLLQNTTIDRFYRCYLTPNCTFALPILEVSEDSESGGSDSSSGGASDGEEKSGNENQGGSSGGGSGGSGDQQSQTKIENNNEIAVIKAGKIIAKLNDDEKFIYSLLSQPSLEQSIKIDNVTDENLTDSTVIFQETAKLIFPMCRYDEDGKPYMEYTIWLSLMVDQIISTHNRAYDSVNGIKNLLTPIVQEKIQKDVDDKLKNTIATYQEKKYDLLELYSKFNAYTYTKFHKYLSTLDNPADYMSEMSIKLNLKLNFVI